MSVVAIILLPMWLLQVSFSFLFWGTTAVNARPEPVVPVSQFSQQMDAHSPPGEPLVRVVHHQDLNKKILAALIVASGLLAGILIFLLCFCIFRQKISKKPSKKSAADSDVPGALSLNPIVSKLNSLTASGRKGPVAAFDYQLLEAATNHFGESNLLFEGGRGRIYKAQFNEKSFAAVKRLNDVGQDAEREFENEMNWLSKIHHQNIIHLQGYCIHGERRYIIYEMMQNQSLDAQLHGPTHGSALTWHLRLKIAVDIAKGLEFLHERCNPPLVHRNLKSSNILLDSDFNARISDFGLAVTAGAPNKNLKLSGSLGYLAPEYLLDGKLTDKGDVYAFGVLLLELLMGRKPVEKTTTSQCQTLVTWAMPQLTDRTKLPSIIAPVIKGTMDLKHLYQVAAVAVLCVQPEPSYRPLITDVLHSLIPLVPVELGGSLRVEVAPSAIKDDALHMKG